MPQELSRTTARKRITLSGGAQVDVPVITKISFFDPNDRGQETQYTVDNSHTSLRRVHIEPLIEGDLDVERVDVWPVFDASERGQETQLTLDNYTKGNPGPPYFIAHLKTHVVKYFDINGDENNYIQSELIDSFAVVDPNDRGQETIYTLNNPQNDDDAQADPSDPEISDSGNGIDPPWRVDPFQNLIGTSQGPGYLLFNIDIGWSNNATSTGSLVPYSTGGPTAPPVDPLCGGTPGYQGSYCPSTYFKIRGQPFGPGWEGSGLPATGNTLWNSAGQELNLAIVPNIVQCDKVQGDPLSTADTAAYPDFSDQLAFSVTGWNSVNGGTLYDLGKRALSVYQWAAVSFNLTGATITNNNSTGGPTVYEIIGTKNSIVHTSLNNAPPPFNTYVHVGIPYPNISTNYYNVVDQPWFSDVNGYCDMRPTYTVPGTSTADPDFEPDANHRFQLVFRVTCLFKEIEPSA